MGMVVILLRVTESQLDEYLRDSSALENRITNEDIYHDNTSLNIDKAWDGSIYLLTGQNYWNATHPLASALFSGQLIDKDQDLGLGPAHYRLPSQVKQLNGVVSTITEADLRERYQPNRMAEMKVYPDIWDQDQIDAFDYLKNYFKLFQAFYNLAAIDHNALITMLA